MMDVKSDLKTITREKLSKAASSIFIDRSLSIIEESAENKESLLAAADKLSKRIALFIDTDLAKKVFDVLSQEIKNRELTPGTRRKHIRIALTNKINVTCDGKASDLYTVNISAGGMFIKTEKPFPVGSKVLVSLPLKAGSPLQLKGTVAHIKRDNGKQPPGMGIEFKEVRDDELKMLRDFVIRASAQDILGRKEETGIKPS